MSLQENWRVLSCGLQENWRVLSCGCRIGACFRHPLSKDREIGMGCSPTNGLYQSRGLADGVVAFPLVSPLFCSPDFRSTTSIGFPKPPFVLVPGPLFVIFHCLPPLSFLGFPLFLCFVGSILLLLICVPVIRKLFHHVGVALKHKTDLSWLLPWQEQGLC